LFYIFRLTNELNSIEGEIWREKLPPNNQNDDEYYLIYLKQKTNYSENNSYEWYQTHADQFYLDACFVLAIQFYTYCIELQPNITNIYLKRAACYLKVFEVYLNKYFIFAKKKTNKSFLFFSHKKF
jgi:hypothetical protein